MGNGDRGAAMGSYWRVGQETRGSGGRRAGRKSRAHGRAGPGRRDAAREEGGLGVGGRCGGNGRGQGWVEGEEAVGGGGEGDDVVAECGGGPEGRELVVVTLQVGGDATRGPSVITVRALELLNLSAFLPLLES
ncbi:hypothetical protein NL676_008613 [Syzygium grande]|nr:hypothetical protein NL676_008613 [Syzygium grande]